MFNRKASVVLFSVWILTVISFIIYKGILPGWQEERSDFSNYYASSSLLIEGEKISMFYDNEWFNQKAIDIGVKEGAKFSPFPPVTAFLYLPLTAFNPLLAKRVWLICNLLLLIAIVFQMKSISSLSLVEIIFVLSLFFIPIASNIRLGQAYLVFTFLLIQFLKAIKRENYFFGGGLLGFAASIKYFPITYFLYAFPKPKKQFLYGLTVLIIVSCLLPLATDGLSPYLAFFAEFVNHLNGNLSGQGQFSYTFQSIDVLLANLFIYDANLNPNSIVDLPILKTGLKFLWIIILIYLGYRIYQKGIRTNKELAIANCILIGTLIIPASASYHLLLLFPTILFVFNFLKKQKNSFKQLITIATFTLISCTILPHHIPNINWSPTLNTLIHFPRLYSLIALSVSLFIIQKHYLRSE